MRQALPEDRQWTSQTPSLMGAQGARNQPLRNKVEGQEQVLSEERG
jgi:hypothetical protein